MSEQHLCILSPHFVPANLTAVHRTRLWSQHIEEFGWQLSVVTTDSAYYEEALDDSLSNTLGSNINVYRCKAFPIKPIRWVGDIGIRSLPWYIKTISEIHKKHPIDFLHIAIPSNFASLVGRIIWLKYNIPYGIDYIDPWVLDSAHSARPLSKGWFSNQLAKLLEPWVVRRASLITGICREYYDGMLRRNPSVKTRAVLTEMPYGLGEQDYVHAARLKDHNLIFRRNDEFINLVYAGALLPHGRVVLREFMLTLATLKQQKPSLYKRLRVHFIGTAPASGSIVQPLADDLDLAECVIETPERMPYLQVLQHLVESDVCLVLGGSDEKYNPSKLFQTAASGNPVLVVLNEASPAIDAVRQIDACRLVTFPDDGLGIASSLVSTLTEMISESQHLANSSTTTGVPVETNPTRRSRGSGALFTARDSSRVLASALNRAVERSQTAER